MRPLSLTGYVDNCSMGWSSPALKGKMHFALNLSERLLISLIKRNMDNSYIRFDNFYHCPGLFCDLQLKSALAKRVTFRPTHSGLIAATK
jgi:hypothetical protein